VSTNDDLAAWGEPPATPTDEFLADLIDTVLNKLAGGEEVRVETLTAARPDLLERGRRLIDDVRLLCRSAAGVWEYSSRFGASSDLASEETLELEPAAGARPPKGAAGEGTLPDPFPGEFRVRRLLGSGTFGEVWLADDLNLGRPVALKTLRLADRRRVSVPALAALRNEARLLAAVRHPNLVPVYAWRQSGEDHYLVLQYVSGGSLHGRVKEHGPLPWATAARYIADVAEGLLELHARGIVHRDVKPANVLWDPDADEALLTDLGVSARLADVNDVAGTPDYMAPEAFDGRVSPALDVYGLAATLFRLVAGEVPFPARTVEELRRRVAAGLPEPDPRCAGLPAPLESVLRAALAADPDGRPPLRDFVSALRGALNLLLVDALTPPGTQAPAGQVDLRLIVSRIGGGDAFEPVAATQPRPERVLRDLKRVPPPPRQVALRTGDRVRIEVEADRPGFVTVFNVGPTGNLNLLYPAGALAAPVGAHERLHVLDVELTPPAGRERLVALWSRWPLPLRLEELLSLAERGEVPGSAPYRATRDMVRVQESVQNLRPEDWRAVVLELEHCD
jgi:serine/threonine protein kinase